ncbi:MAG: hypothetical protein I8H70_04960, partial [Burkholderiales bacterium]|nr:hypothetical protein [Burkholderiales bacterium]
MASWAMAPAGLASCGGLSRRSAALALGAFLGLSLSPPASVSAPLVNGVAPAGPVPLAAEFAREVAPRLLVPDDERLAYAARLQDALT